MKCIYPQTKYRTRNGTMFKYEHACGQCLSCRITKRTAWKGRIMLEAMDWPATSFITLTYQDKYLKSQELQYNDFKKFIKNIRQQTGRKFRYFGCGEYGSERHRPHWHVILFGHNFMDTEPVAKAWSELDRRTGKRDLLGRIECSEITAARAGYVAKYTLKHAGNNEKPPEHFIPERAFMSRQPGIGSGNLDILYAAILRGAQQTGLTTRQFFDEHFKSIRIGTSRLPVHPYIHAKIEKRITAEETKGFTPQRYADRLEELEDERRVKGLARTLYNKTNREIEIEDTKKLCERRNRKTLMVRKL